MLYNLSNSEDCELIHLAQFISALVNRDCNYGCLKYEWKFIPILLLKSITDSDINLFPPPPKKKKQRSYLTAILGITFFSSIYRKVDYMS